MIIEIYTMEKIAFWVHLKDAFLGKWRKWVDYVSERRSDFVVINK